MENIVKKIKVRGLHFVLGMCYSSSLTYTALCEQANK